MKRKDILFFDFIEIENKILGIFVYFFVYLKEEKLNVSLIKEFLKNKE